MSLLKLKLLQELSTPKKEVENVFCLRNFRRRKLDEKLFLHSEQTKVRKIKAVTFPEEEKGSVSVRDLPNQINEKFFCAKANQFKFSHELTRFPTAIR